MSTTTDSIQYISNSSVGVATESKDQLKSKNVNMGNGKYFYNLYNSRAVPVYTRKFVKPPIFNPKIVIALLDYSNWAKMTLVWCNGTRQERTRKWNKIRKKTKTKVHWIEISESPLVLADPPETQWLELAKAKYCNCCLPSSCNWEFTCSCYAKLVKLDQGILSYLVIAAWRCRVVLWRFAVVAGWWKVLSCKSGSISSSYILYSNRCRDRCRRAPDEVQWTWDGQEGGSFHVAGVSMTM